MLVDVDLRLDLDLGSGFKSPTQFARVVTEGWMAREAYCLKCGTGSLAPTTPNTRALDFRCGDCREPYELKSSRRPFGDRVLDGEYASFRRAIASHDNPNLFLLNYDLERGEVTDLRGIPRYAVSALSVIPRRPLGPLARRSGWQGCNIDLTRLPSAAVVDVVVAGVVRPPRVVLDDWAGMEFIESSGRSGREWLPDILSCLRRIPTDEFALSEVYRFADELHNVHPRNLNVEPKIRQQLQILVAQGLLERIRPGRYRKSPRFSGAHVRSA